MYVLQIPLWKIVGFAEEFTSKFTAHGGKAYHRGILEIIQVQCVAVLTLNVGALCVDCVHGHILRTTDVERITLHLPLKLRPYGRIEMHILLLLLARLQT